MPVVLFRLTGVRYVVLFQTKENGDKGTGIFFNDESKDYGRRGEKMANFVNEEKFFEWYESVAADEKYSRSELLNEAVMNFANTGQACYILPASKTKSGKEERYSYQVENLGCCGASTIYVYF